MTRPAEIQAPRFQTSPDGLSVPKSCPFCRGEAAVNTIQWSAEHLAEQGLPEGIRFGVNCMRCGVNNRGGNGAATPDEAIARWNKRAEPVAIVALLAETARLEAALGVALLDRQRLDWLDDRAPAVNPQVSGGWVIEDGDQDDVWTLARTRKGIRESIDAAMQAAGVTR